MSASANRYAALAPSDLTTPKKRKSKKNGSTPSPTPPGSHNLKLNGNGNGMLHRGGKVNEKSLDEDDALEMGGDVDARKSRRALTGDEKTNGVVEGVVGEEGKQGKGGLTPKDQKAMVLLVSLYLLQGIPVGLAFGSVPFLLRASLSYSQIALFTLASYPYSLKLLWSPIVDAVFSKRIGRRKSWIIPVQFMVGMMLWWLGNNVGVLMESGVDGTPDVQRLTVLFFILVMFAATQDIAVDGWALELLSKDNLSYASTAQTVGLNIGYFLSFTVFLAFNSLEFSNARWRALFQLAPQTYPLMTLPGYLQFSGVCFFIITTYLTFFQPEDAVPASGSGSAEDGEMAIKKVYTIMLQIVRLPHVQKFIVLHLVCKLGTAANDAATSLKLLEKGLSKEDLALAVLIDFPFQIFFGYLAAKWSNGDKPLNPWISAMWFRLGFAAWGMGLVHFFPQGKELPTYYFLLVIASTVFSSFAQTVQFVGISAFHTQVADPLIGGTYMTLLNTVSNLGGTWPKFFVLKGVDYFTDATCRVVKADESELIMKASECVSDHGKAACADLGGVCETHRDGYYAMQMMCLACGAVLLLFLVAPEARRLQALPASAWQVKREKR